MSGNFVQRGGLWVVGQFILLPAVAIFGVVFRQSPPFGLALAFAVVFFLAFVICAGAGLKTLGPNLTAFPKPREQAELVRHGIYGLIRHPLYTAVICAAVGWSLFWQSWLALAVSLVLAIYFDAKARHEERWLRQQFPDYIQYEKCVRRFIPWIY